jgi:hypothetical protein
MSQWLKKSTAYTFRIGPFVDSTDGFTPETALTIAYTSCLLSKAGAAFAAKNDTTNLTSTGTTEGYYTCVLNTTDTGTLGPLRVHIYVSGALPVWQDFVVVPPNVYESLVTGVEWLEACTTAPKIAISGTDITTYKQDDSTAQFTVVGTFAAGADVLTGSAGKT